VVDQVTDLLYIGGARSTWDAPQLHEAGVTAVLKLYEGQPAWPPDFTVLDMPFEDGQPIPEGYLERGVDFIEQNVRAGRAVLVTCGAGISRSSTLVLAYLVGREGYDLSDAFRLLRERHPQADPLPALWGSLLDFLKVSYTWADVVSWR
jgi:protein-tyrosine phosphatase